MLRFAAIALVGALSAVGAAKAVVSLDELRRPELRAPSAATATLGGAEGGAAQITKGDDGHFWAQASVDGKAVRFLVDTGATAVSLSMADAQRLGIDTSKLNYDYNVIIMADLAFQTPHGYHQCTFGGSRKPHARARRPCISTNTKIDEL